MIIFREFKRNLHICCKTSLFDARVSVPATSNRRCIHDPRNRSGCSAAITGNNNNAQHRSPESSSSTHTNYSRHYISGPASTNLDDSHEFEIDFESKFNWFINTKKPEDQKSEEIYLFPPKQEFNRIEELNSLHSFTLLGKDLNLQRNIRENIEIEELEDNFDEPYGDVEKDPINGTCEENLGSYSFETFHWLRKTNSTNTKIDLKSPISHFYQQRLQQSHYGPLFLNDFISGQGDDTTDSYCLKRVAPPPPITDNTLVELVTCELRRVYGYNRHCAHYIAACLSKPFYATDQERRNDEVLYSAASDTSVSGIQNAVTAVYRNIQGLHSLSVSPLTLYNSPHLIRVPHSDVLSRLPLVDELFPGRSVEAAPLTLYPRDVLQQVEGDFQYERRWFTPDHANRVLLIAHLLQMPLSVVCSALCSHLNFCLLSRDQLVRVCLNLQTVLKYRLSKISILRQPKLLIQSPNALSVRLEAMAAATNSGRAIAALHLLHAVDHQPLWNLSHIGNPTSVTCEELEHVAQNTNRLEGNDQSLEINDEEFQLLVDKGLFPYNDQLKPRIIGNGFMLPNDVEKENEIQKLKNLPKADLSHIVDTEYTAPPAYFAYCNFDSLYRQHLAASKPNKSRLSWE